MRQDLSGVQRRRPQARQAPARPTARPAPVVVARGDAPQTRKRDFKRAEAFKGHRAFYQALAAAGVHHPDVQAAEQHSTRVFKDPRSTPKQKRDAKQAAIVVFTEHQKGALKAAEHIYRTYLHGLYGKVQGEFGPTMPKSSFQGAKPGNYAQVDRATPNTVHFNPTQALAFMGPKHFPDGTRNGERLVADGVPLHEWTHTRQRLQSPSTPFKSKQLVEGGAEVNASRLAKQLGMLYEQGGNRDYARWRREVERTLGADWVRRNLTKR